MVAKKNTQSFINRLIIPGLLPEISRESISKLSEKEIEKLVEDRINSILSEPLSGRKKGRRFARSKTPNKNDNYPTPAPLVWAVADYFKSIFPPVATDAMPPGVPTTLNFPVILEPAAGEGLLVKELEKLGYPVEPSCITREPSVDYLTKDCSGFDYVITNPPYSLWTEFVMKAKTHCKRFAFMGPHGYLATGKRYKLGIWDNLRYLFSFDRQVRFDDEKTPLDNKLSSGASKSAWYIWDMDYKGSFYSAKVLDVDPYMRRKS